MTVIRMMPPDPAFTRNRESFLGVSFNTTKQDVILELIKGSERGTSFRYVVTPNVDHVVRLSENNDFAQYYDQAWLSLCDSRPIAMLARLISLNLPLLPGSDLTAWLFKSVLQDGDLITLIAANNNIVRDLRAAYPRLHFRALVPPANVWADSQALEACVEFAARGKARFVFIAIGSPQSEKIAHALSRHPDARGIGFCIGASLEFLVGTKKRAPLWMRRIGLEWFHRLASEPKRLWRRYLYSALPLMRLFLNEATNRQQHRT